jgi:DNA polymerase III subunit delta
MTEAAPATALAYFWGEDAYLIEDAARRFKAELDARSEVPLETWRTSADDDDATGRGRLLDELVQRLATAPLFGGGTFVLVRQPGGLLREATARERTLGLLERVAPGNGLCFVDLVASGGRAPAQGGALREAIAAHGGRVADFPALTRERMAGWLARRATELGVTLAPGAAQVLAERVGANVREGDVDRRRATELANGELEKLALYRPDQPVSREDVVELVDEAVPGSTWAFLDALGERRSREAALLLARLLEGGTPLPLLISQVHRRLRDLIIIRDLLARDVRPPDLVRELKMQPFRAQKLTGQARAWEQGELDLALEELFELDLLSKGIAPDGGQRSLSEDRSELALVAWLSRHAGGNAEGSRAGREEASRRATG